jgi:hypothetical protein
VDNNFFSNSAIPSFIFCFAATNDPLGKSFVTENCFGKLVSMVSLFLFSYIKLQLAVVPANVVFTISTFPANGGQPKIGASSRRWI